MITLIMVEKWSANVEYNFGPTSISTGPQSAYTIAVTHTRSQTHTHLLCEVRKPRCRQVNIRSTWQQWCVMRFCSGNKVFVGTLEHGHITSLLILGDQSPVGIATGTWLRPEARPESQCPEREHRHKECSSGRKKFRSGHGDPRPQPLRWDRFDLKPNKLRENNFFSGKSTLICVNRSLNCKLNFTAWLRPNIYFHISF